jgi:hypothetical protein
MFERATELNTPAAGTIGIFWFYKDQLLACSVPLTQAERRGQRLDSPLGHVSVWPRLVAQHRKRWPLLSILEYDEVPRGRVIFDLLKQTFVIYMDESLFVRSATGLRPEPGVAEALRTSFGLQEQQVQFATDPHYRLMLSVADDDGR